MAALITRAEARVVDEPEDRADIEALVEPVTREALLRAAAMDD